MTAATGEYLDRLVAIYGVERTKKRVWWTLWLWRRWETDESLRARAVAVLRRTL